MHEWDGITPIEETVEALDALVRAGKVRYVGCSNYSAWHISKALAAADRRHQHRFVAQQIHYTLNAREAEFELIPLSQDQGLGVLVWSPSRAASFPANTGVPAVPIRAGTSEDIASP